ncbi:MAG: hypothetical protein H8D32_03340 [Dehalococcoidia bacterium]|nr:hypothetical protein [Dehalococcoidia bacterium]
MEKSGTFTVLGKLAPILLGSQEDALAKRLATTLILPVTRASEIKPSPLVAILIPSLTAPKELLAVICHKNNHKARSKLISR